MQCAVYNVQGMQYARQAGACSVHSTMYNGNYAIYAQSKVCSAQCKMCRVCDMHNVKNVHNVQGAMCRAQGACRVISWLSRGRRCHTNHNAHSAQKFGSRNVRFLYFYTIVVFISMILRDQDIRSGCQIIYASFFGQDGKLTCNIIILSLDHHHNHH